MFCFFVFVAFSLTSRALDRDRNQVELTVDTVQIFEVMYLYLCFCLCV